MATTGPMLVTGLEAEVRTFQNNVCSCGRFSSLFYRVKLGWSSNPADKSETTCFCSWCAGERFRFTPHLIKPFKNSTFVAPGEPEFREAGMKLVLLPDPKATLTDDERGDVVTYTRSSTEGGEGNRTLEEQSFNLREWALTQGSAGLVHRVNEGMDWEKLAEFQWAKSMADARLCDSKFRECDQFRHIERKDMRQVAVKARRTPNEGEVALLDEARSLWLRVDPLVSADLDLVWVKPQGEAARTELQVKIDLPNGSVRRLFYSLPVWEDTKR